MPNVWTHMLFAERIAHKSNIDIAVYKSVFNLGAQGPDPFFYHNFWPWIKDKSVVKIGGKLHTEHCGEFIIEMLKYLKNNDDDLLKYYVLGFISHHILDRNTHPYIIYRSGEEGNKHQKLEVIIDTLLMKEFNNLETWKTPVYKRIYVGKNLPTIIVSTMSFLLKKVHGIDTPNLSEIINQSYQDMVKALRVLFDPTGIKNKVLGNLISPFSYTKNIPDKDFLNIYRNESVHPAIMEEKSNESFYDIFDRAEKEGINIFIAVVDYLNDHKSIDDVHELIGDISYETGKPCGEKLELKYFYPIL